MQELINGIHHIEALELLSKLDDKSIDMILTSPPYDNLRTYKGFAWDFEAIARESYRVLKDGGVLVWVVGDATVNGSETLTSFRQALYFVDVCGFKMHDTMIYQKDSAPFPDDRRYYAVFEYMLVLSKGTPKTVNLLKERVNKYIGDKISTTQRTRNGSIEKSHGLVNGKVIQEMGVLFNVWEISVGFMRATTDKEAYEHPAIFPEELARRHIHTWSNEGDIVLDYFSGSGTTAKIAQKLNRQFIAGDISAEYVQLARQRLQNANPFEDSVLKNGEKQLSLFRDLPE